MNLALSLCIAGWCALGPAATAQTLPQVVKAFGVSEQSGTGSRAALIEGDDGALYGTTEYGGIYDGGTVFKMAANGTNYTVLKHFSGSGGDGTRPYAGLLKATNGLLYGTTCYGGSNSVGTIFRLAQDGGNYAVLKNFSTNAADGRNPRAGLMQASDGNLYGTTYGGGSSNQGTIFKLGADGGSYAMLASFTGRTNHGGKPFAGLVEGTNGALYGTTFVGGLSNRGTVFRLNKDGTGFSLLKSFTGTSGDGRHPCAGLIRGSDNWLYGSTRIGGVSNWGNIFRLGQDGSGYSVIGSFTDPNGGRHPHGRLVEGADGALYGTTYQGGASNLGTVFKLAKDGSGGLVQLAAFSQAFTDGANPEAGLLKASDGWLYATTCRGGAASYGTIFKLAEGGTNFATVRDFSLSGDDGSFATKVFQASDGALYGTTESGGSNDLGTVFKLNADGSGQAILHHFTRANADGNYPTMLLEAADGWLYGTTHSGGTSNLGTVFKLTTSGSNYAVLRSFAGPDGGNPFGITVSADGRVFGTAYRGGSNQNGVVYSMSSDGSDFAVLHSFTGTNGDGAGPGAGLVLSGNGVLFGTTEQGGISNNGTIFRLGANGADYAVLKVFDGGAGGFGPWGGLVLDGDGLLYGTTAGDVVNSGGGGVVFSMNTNGSNYRVLRNFDRAVFPSAGLVKAPNGLFYGTAEYGGSNGVGAVYALSGSGGSYAEICGFSTGTGGSRPQSGLSIGRRGVLYGITVDSAAMGLGAVFALDSPVNVTSIRYIHHAVLTLAGASNQTYVIQAATNPVASAWINLGTNMVSVDNLDVFHDFAATNHPARFYRSTSP